MSITGSSEDVVVFLVLVRGLRLLAEQVDYPQSRELVQQLLWCTRIRIVCCAVCYCS